MTLFMRQNYFSLFIFFLIGCNSLPEEKKLEQKNPTTYIYNISKEVLRSQLISNIDRFRSIHLTLLYDEIGIEPLDTLEIFEPPKNKYDFYLEQEIYWQFKSLVYFVDGNPALYEAGFHLHLEEIDKQRTKVSIYTIRPRIVLGTDFLPSPPHFVRKSRYMNVTPSTIEEYKILVLVGQIVNEANMPLILYPR